MNIIKKYIKSLKSAGVKSIDEYVSSANDAIKKLSPDANLNKSLYDAKTLLDSLGGIVLVLMQDEKREQLNKNRLILKGFSKSLGDRYSFYKEVDINTNRYMHILIMIDLFITNICAAYCNMSISTKKIIKKNTEQFKYYGLISSQLLSYVECYEERVLAYNLQKGK